MSVLASRPHTTTRPADRFTCQRCGWQGKYNRGRGRPLLCKDCKHTTTTAKEPSR